MVYSLYKDDKKDYNNEIVAFCIVNFCLDKLHIVNKIGNLSL